MRLSLAVLAGSTVAFASAMTPTLTPTAPEAAAPITIHADRVLDGKGGTIAGGTVVVDGDKISAVNTASGGATYDLKGMTILPGLIDAHAHIAWYFNANERLQQPSGRDTPAQAMQSILASAGNAYATLMG